jgi:hypothetical protein
MGSDLIAAKAYRRQERHGKRNNGIETEKLRDRKMRTGKSKRKAFNAEARRGAEKRGDGRIMETGVALEVFAAMPLLRSLAGYMAIVDYKHGAPNGALRSTASISSQKEACKDQQASTAIPSCGPGNL